MELLKRIYKSFVMTFSEIIWIYYGIVMITSIEWLSPEFFDLTWWIIAGAAGYALNALLSKRNNRILFFVANILTIGFLVYKNWNDIVPSEAWDFGVAVSIGLGLVFIRSARLVYREITRQEMLRRFEGNLIYYIVFAGVFTHYKWINETFHSFFIAAIIMSLMGMILTLQSHEGDEEGQNTEIIKVGQAGWFIKGVSLLLLLIPVVSLILFLPSVNGALNTLIMSVWAGIKFLLHTMGRFFTWLISLFPEPKAGDMPIPPPSQAGPSEVPQKMLGSIPFTWIIAAVAVAGVIISVWVFSRLMRNKGLARSIKVNHIRVIGEPWWVNLRDRLKGIFHGLKIRLLMRFTYFYRHPVYWYFHLLQRWGEKNGFYRNKSETSREYVGRIISRIPEEEDSFTQGDKSYRISELLGELSSKYQAAYYGLCLEEFEDVEYRILMRQLRNIRLSSKTK